jgi:DNA-binding transcriptional ArsR family regulator
VERILARVSLLVMRGVDDLMKVRFAWSPLFETTGAVRTFVDQRAGPYHHSWHQLVAERVARIDLGPLIAVQPLRGFVPDFLSPPPNTSAPRVRDQLAEVRATPAEQVEKELRLCRQTVTDPQHQKLLDSYLADPIAARDFLATRLGEVWRELVAPFWVRIRTLLDRDIQDRTRLLARHGLRRVLDELHPKIRWTANGLVVDDGGDATIEVDERGLVLMPSAYLWPLATAVVAEPWQPTIAYPARGIAELWSSPQAAPDALAKLVGRSRALVLSGLDRPLSTTAVALHIGLSPAGASGHLIALRNAGLVATARHGHEVLYRRTPLGNSLLRGRSERPSRTSTPSPQPRFRTRNRRE